MGFLSFIGKAIGTVAKVALPFVGGPVGSLASQLLSSKAPMSGTATKLNVLGKFSIPILRAKSPTFGNQTQSMPTIAARSPVMPGGAIATPQGIMASGGGVPPATYGGRRTGGKRRKRRSTSSRRNSRARNSQRRRSGRKGRKLKFGSAAYRKKYLGHR